MIYIGIDPGSSGGGIAAINDDGDAVTSAMPQTPRDIFDTLNELVALLVGDRPTPRLYAALEIVGPRPGEGGTSSFKFGQSYGHLEMALVGHRIPYTLVRPVAWQKQVGIIKKPKEPDTPWKNRLKAEAQRVFPANKVVLATADALLIARYAQDTCPFRPHVQ